MRQAIAGIWVLHLADAKMQYVPAGGESAAEEDIPGQVQHFCSILYRGSPVSHGSLSILYSTIPASGPDTTAIPTAVPSKGMSSCAPGCCSDSAPVHARIPGGWRHHLPAPNPG